MNISSIILAGGKSKRMGTDKAFLKLNNKLLIDIAIELAEKVSDNIIISGTDNRLENYKYPVLKDVIPEIGPVGGIYTCLSQAENDYSLVLSCDMPFVSMELVERIISKVNNEDIIVPFNNNYFEPLCALYHKRVLPIIKDMIANKNYKLHNLILNSNYKALAFKELNCDANAFRNFNTPEDLKNA